MNMQEGSDSAMSLEALLEAIFCFLDLNEINIALKEEEAKIYITMFSNQSLPLIMSILYWPRLAKLKPMYWIKTMTSTYQCITRSTSRTLKTSGWVPNDYLNPNISSMKMVSWNCRGAGNKAFHTHAHELYRLHRL